MLGFPFRSRRGDPGSSGRMVLRAVPGGGSITFLSIEALWEDHLFHPLRDWVATQLIPAKAIALYGGAGVTWAKLVAEDQADDSMADIERRL